MSHAHRHPELFSSPSLEDVPHGTVLLAHGFGEHRGRYDRFIDALNEAGFDAWTFDFTGHGTSPGRRSRVDVGALIGEHLDARRDVLERSRTSDLLLFGHSMGGLITLASTLLSPARVGAVAVTGPALRPLPHINGTVATLGAKVGSLLPFLASVALDTELLSRDPQVVADYEADPSVYHGKVPLITGASMAVQGRQVIRHANLLARPTLILHGEDDGLASFEGSVEFAERAGDLVELVTFEGAYHELLNEPEQETYTRAIVDWFAKWS